MEHTITTIRKLFEADERLQKLKRRWLETRDLDDLLVFIHSHRRSGKSDLPAGAYQQVGQAYEAAKFLNKDLADVLYSIRSDFLSPYMPINLQNNSIAVFKINNRTIHVTRAATIFNVVNAATDSIFDQAARALGVFTSRQRSAPTWIAYTKDSLRPIISNVGGNTLEQALRNIVEQLGMTRQRKVYPYVQSAFTQTFSGVRQTTLGESKQRRKSKRYSEEYRAERSWVDIERRKKMKRSFGSRVTSGAVKGALIGGGIAGGVTAGPYLSNLNVIRNLPQGLRNEVNARARRAIASGAIIGTAVGGVGGALGWRKDQKTLKRIKARLAAKTAKRKDKTKESEDRVR